MHTQTPEELRERFELFLDAVHAGFWDWHIETGREWWSPQFFKLIGYIPHEITPDYNLWINEILHPTDKANVEAAIRRHIENGQPYALEIRMLHKTEGYKWFETRGMAKFDQDGKATRMVGSIVDIHTKKLNQILQEKYEFLLEEMSQMANIGAWEYNIGADSPTWSRETYQIHEIPVGTKIMLDQALSVFADSSKPLVEEAFANGLNHGIPYDLDVQLITPSNKTKWVRTIGKPFRNEDGVLAGMRGVIQDIEKPKTLEQERNLTIDLLSNHNKRLQNFAHIISHNLRSHSSNLQLLVSFLQNEVELGAHKEIIEMLSTTSQNLHETLNSLSEVVRLQSQTVVEKKDINLEVLFDRTIKVLSAQIEANHIEIIPDFTAGKIVCYDPIYGESLMLNLISNAIKYRDKQKKSYLKVSTQIVDGRAILLFEDNGLGIDLKKNGDKVFGMYKTFHQNPESRGLGLFLTKNQLEAFQYSIEIESTPGRGTTFKVKF